MSRTELADAVEVHYQTIGCLELRDVLDLPDRFLDERQLAVRNQVYVEAYRWYAGVTVILASAGLVAFSVSVSAKTPTPGPSTSRGTGA